ncbi:GPN-loop GTPase 1 [Binucleata daphniae]
MIYAASLACRYGVECNCVFNKSDLVHNTVMYEWMKDYNKFRESLDQNEMSSTMTASLALYFEEFYSDFKHCYISSVVGSGREDFFSMIDDE